MDQRFRSQGLNVDVVPGVVAPAGTPSYLACLMAHQNAVQSAKQSDAGNVLIFEDDVVFLQPWSWIKNALRDVPADYDLVRLCIITDGAYLRRHVKGQIFRSWRAFGTQCYLVNSRCYDTILGFPHTDPLDDQLNDAGLVQYAIHPIPVYHEIGSSYLGNPWLQSRDDLGSESMNREAAILVIDSALNQITAPYNTQLRIVQALSTLKDQAHTQELRFLRNVLEKLPVTRETAKNIAHALFVLSVDESSGKDVKPA